jgi:hypothetical protein
MKINKVFVMLAVCFFANKIDAATFTIVNYTGGEIIVTPKWDRCPEINDTLQDGEKSRKYDTGILMGVGSRVHSISWVQNHEERKGYYVNLYDIQSALMRNRMFYIFKDGFYEHNFVNFPHKSSGVQEAAVNVFVN